MGKWLVLGVMVLASTTWAAPQAWKVQSYDTPMTCRLVNDVGARQMFGPGFSFATNYCFDETGFGVGTTARDNGDLVCQIVVINEPDFPDSINTLAFYCGSAPGRYFWCAEPPAPCVEFNPHDPR